MKNKMKKRSDESSFLTNLETIKKKQSQKRFFDALADFFIQMRMVLFKKTAGATIEVLQTQIEKLHIEIARTEELYHHLEQYSKKLEKTNVSLEEQLASLLGDVEIEDLPELQRKSDEYKLLQMALRKIKELYEPLNRFSVSIQIKNILTEMNCGLQDCVDDFQKLKIYKKYFEKFSQIPALAFRAGQFLDDKKLFKDKEQLNDFLAILEKESSVQTVLDQFLAENHNKINKILDEIPILQ